MNQNKLNLAQRVPFYYGWIVVPAAVIGVIMTLPGQTAGFSAFTEPVLALSGLGRTQLSFAYMAGTITSGFILPFMGPLLDRFGARYFMGFATIGLGLVLFLLSRIDLNAAWLMGLFPDAPSAVIYIILLVPGLFGIRFFGQGLMSMTSNTMVSRWFSRSRGKAIAVVGVFNSLAFASAPAVLNSIVNAAGWKNAWMLLAITVGLGMTLLALLFYRDSPEACGIHVEGSSDSKPLVVDGTPLKEALRTRAFWVIAAAVSIHSFVFTGITFHIQALGIQSGLSIEKTVSIFLPISFISIPLSFLGSWLSDRIKIKYIVFFMLAGQVIGFISLFFFNTHAGFIMTIAGLGLGSSMFGPVNATAMPAYFGRKHLGSINGVLVSAGVIASSLGPVFMSFINDVTGALRYGAVIAAVLPVIVLFLALGMESQPRKEAPLKQEGR